MNKKPFNARQTECPASPAFFQSIPKYFRMRCRCANRESCQGVDIQELKAIPVCDYADYQEIKVQEQVIHRFGYIK